MAGAGDVTVPQLFTELQKSIQKNDHKLGVYILISSKNSDWIYSVRIHDIFEVIAKRIFSKIAKSDFLLSEDRSTTQNGAKLYRDEIQKKLSSLCLKDF